MHLCCGQGNAKMAISSHLDHEHQGTHLAVLVRRHVGPLELCLPSPRSSSRRFKHILSSSSSSASVSKSWTLFVPICTPCLLASDLVPALSLFVHTFIMASPAPPRPKTPRRSLKRQKSGIFESVFSYVSQEVTNFVASATGAPKNEVILRSGPVSTTRD